MRNHLRTSLVVLGGMTLLSGVVYPLGVTLLAQTLFPHPANGSLVVRNGRPTGSEQIGQPFTKPEYFWGRLSATGPVPYNAAASSGSNFGPRHPDLAKNAKARLDALRESDPSIDIVCLVLDATKPFGKGDQWVARHLDLPSTVVVVNKIDRSSRDQVAAQLAAASELEAESYFPVSARTGAGVDALVDHLVARAPEGPAFFPPGTVRDVPEEQWVAELVREQLLAVTRDELPYSIATRVVEWEGNRITVETQADADGRFLIERVPSASGRIEARAEGWRTTGTECSFDGGEVELELEPAHALEGWALDAQGLAVAGVQITVQPVAPLLRAASMMVSVLRSSTNTTSSLKCMSVLLVGHRIPAVAARPVSFE